MSNRIRITKRFEGASWIVEAEVAMDSDSTFPREIFLWTIGREGRLETFEAIGHADQLARYPVYSPERKDNFGIHLVKYNRAKVLADSEESADSAITVLKSAFTNLLISYTRNSLPTEEFFP